MHHQNSSLTTVEDFMRLSYKTRVVQDRCNDEICFMAYNDELPGCMAQGATWKEAVDNLKAARRDYIGALLEESIEIPIPTGSNVPDAQWQVVPLPRVAALPVGELVS